MTQQKRSKEQRDAVKFYTRMARIQGGLTHAQFGEPLGVGRAWSSAWQCLGTAPLPRIVWQVFKKGLGEPWFSWAIRMLELQGIDLNDIVSLEELHNNTTDLYDRLLE